MENYTKSVLMNTVDSLTRTCREVELFSLQEGERLPGRDAVISIIEELRKVIFPGYFGEENIMAASPEYFIGSSVANIYEKLRLQVGTALTYKHHGCDNCKDISRRAEAVCNLFFEQLPSIQQLLIKDVEAAFNGDPAAKSREEIIFSYPGLYAIFVYRIANILYKEEVPFIPRIMTEHAHGITGIDINPGAAIGEYFFIDHGTGIVIGETTMIGSHVKLYQGVTLGALSTRSGQQLAGVKRHPTIEDNVTIYANSTILGGNTVIGKESVIGGNSFITESIPASSRVSVKNQEGNLNIDKRK